MVKGKSGINAADLETIAIAGQDLYVSLEQE